MLKSLNQLSKNEEYNSEFIHICEHNSPNNLKPGNSLNIIFSNKCKNTFAWCNQFVEDSNDIENQQLEWTLHSLDEIYGVIVNNYINKARRDQLDIKTGLIINDELMKNYYDFLKKYEYLTEKSPVYKLCKQSRHWQQEVGDTFIGDEDIEEYFSFEKLLNEPTEDYFIHEETIEEFFSFEQLLKEAKNHLSEDIILTWGWKKEFLNYNHLDEENTNMPMM